jgi:hypothetical protein
MACAAAVAVCALAAPAGAQAAGAWSFSSSTITSRFCGTDPVTLTQIVESSTFSAVGVFRPDATRNVRVGETFALAVNVQNVSSCDSDAAVVPALRLPAGVRIADVQRPVRCIFFNSTAGTFSDLSSSSSCPQAPATVNGFRQLVPGGLPAGVGYGLADPNNGVELQVLVVADTVGAKVAEARVCDLPAGPCIGSPAANATASIAFTVDADQAGEPPPPPPPVGTTIEYAGSLGMGSTSVRVRGTVVTDRPGAIVAELQDVQGKDPELAGTPEEIEGPVPVQAGEWDVDATFEDHPVPGEQYWVRICFTPLSGAKVCAPYRLSGTLAVITGVRQDPPENIRRSGVTYAATLKPVVLAPYAAGRLRVEYQSMLAFMLGSASTQSVQTIDAGLFGPARSVNQRPDVPVTGLARFVQYRHRACFRTLAPGFITEHMEKCSEWRTFTPS